MRTSSVTPAVVLAIVAAMAAMLWFFPPSTSTFYPLCPFREATGLLCPGCGATRAVAALLHGRFADAFRFNALSVLLLPGMVAYCGVAWVRRLDPGRAVWPRIPNAATALLIGIALGFAVLRNLP